MPVEITEGEARYLVITGQAGYWSLFANPPVEHDSQTVVRVRGRFFLCQESEFSVQAAGPVGVIGGKMKGAHIVKCDDSLDLVAWIKEDMEKFRLRT